METGTLARHFREAPHLNNFEGTGNLMASELQMRLNHSSELLDALLKQLESELGPAGKQTIDVLKAAFELARHDEGAARIATEQLAVAGAAAELNRLGTGTLAETFIETRLVGAKRAGYGLLDGRFDASTILDALYPPVS